MLSSSPPAVPPYGSLIEVARKGAGLSMQRAAQLAGVSKATWIDNTRGYRKRGSRREPIEPKPETIARMARAAAVSPERLETEGGHPGAAVILREILRTEQPVAGAPPGARHAAAPVAEASLEADVEAVVAMLIEVAGDRAQSAAGLWALPDYNGGTALLTDRLDALKGYLQRKTGRTGPAAEQELTNGTAG